MHLKFRGLPNNEPWARQILLVAAKGFSIGEANLQKNRSRNELVGAANSTLKRVGTGVGNGDGNDRISTAMVCPRTRWCFVVTDSKRQKLAHVYFEDDPGRRSAEKLLSRDQARRVADQLCEAAGVVAHDMLGF